MHGWITVHDGENFRKKDGPKPIPVRASSIDMIRPYPQGVRGVHAVLAIHGSYLHVTETQEEIERLILDAERVLE